LIVAKANFECEQLAAAFLAGGGLERLHGCPTRPPPQDEVPRPPRPGAERESEESGGGPLALQGRCATVKWPCPAMRKRALRTTARRAVYCSPSLRDYGGRGRYWRVRRGLQDGAAVIVWTRRQAEYADSSTNEPGVGLQYLQQR
jgi:hypothetical protein